MGQLLGSLVASFVPVSWKLLAFDALGFGLGTGLTPLRTLTSSGNAPCKLEANEQRKSSLAHLTLPIYIKHEVNREDVRGM